MNKNRNKIEIEKSELVRNVIIDNGDADEDEKDEDLLEILREVPLEGVHSLLLSSEFPLGPSMRPFAAVAGGQSRAAGRNPAIKKLHQPENLVSGTRENYRQIFPLCQVKRAAGPEDFVYPGAMSVAARMSAQMVLPPMYGAVYGGVFCLTFHPFLIMVPCQPEEAQIEQGPSRYSHVYLDYRGRNLLLSATGRASLVS